MQARRWWPWAAAALAVVIGAMTVYRAGFGSRLRTDLPVYLAAARAVSAGESPFGVLSPEQGWPYYYPPTLAVLVLPLTTPPLPVAAGLWYAVSAAAFALGAWASRAALGIRGPPTAADGVALGLAFFPTTSALHRGQTGPVLLGLTGGALLGLARRRDGLAGVLLALATAIKVTPGILLPALLLGRRWRAAAAAAAGLVVWLLLLPAPFLGLEGAAGANAAFGRVMVAGSVAAPDTVDLPRPRDPHIPNNQSLTSQVIRHTDGALERAGVLGLSGLLLALTLPLAARGPAPPGVRPQAALLGVTLLAAPIAWHHHHVLLLPALLALTHAGPADRRLARRTLAAFAALALLHFAVKPLRAWGLLGLGTLAVTGAVAAIEWRAWRASGGGPADAPGPEAAGAAAPPPGAPPSG